MGSRREDKEKEEIDEWSLWASLPEKEIAAVLDWTKSIWSSADTIEGESAWPVYNFRQPQSTAQM